MRGWRMLLVGAVLAGWPVAATAQAPGAAQPAPVAADLVQQTFTFIGTELRVTIAGAAGGTIQLVRGAPGMLALRARAVGGLPSAALVPQAEPGELTLTSGTATRVDYVLTVPQNAYVSVHLPGHPAATLGSNEERGAWTWPPQPGPVLKPLP